MTEDRWSGFDFDNAPDVMIAEEYMVQFLTSDAQRDRVTTRLVLKIIAWLRSNDYKVNFKYIESTVQFMIRNTESILDHYGKFNEHLIKN